MHAPMPPAPKPFIFVVDDEPDTRELLKDLFEAAGYFVLDARDGVEALARMRGVVAPAVAVIDLMMPRMDGWELVRAVRADPHHAKFRIVVMTAQGREPVAGADRVLRKPCSPDLLLQAVDELFTVAAEAT